jgi:hypothetical protein
MYQTIRCPNPDHIMKHYHCEHLKYFTKEYEEQFKWGWKCHIPKTKIQKNTKFVYGHSMNLNTYHLHHLCTQCFIFCLENKLRKWDLKYFLVTDIISINTQFRFWTTYDELQSSTKHITRRITHLILLTMLNILEVEAMASILHSCHHMKSYQKQISLR